jgi:hypothetical protein
MKTRTVYLTVRLDITAPDEVSTDTILSDMDYHFGWGDDEVQIESEICGEEFDEDHMSSIMYGVDNNQ